MKRSGFTMIELVFVIVILGILAAVAVPKLTATRDDAKLVSAATEVKTAVSDITQYFTAKGSFAADSDDMTNVKFSADTLAAGAVNYAFGGTADCLTINGASGTSLVITPKLVGMSAQCTALQTRLGYTAATTLDLAGSGVSF